MSASEIRTAIAARISSIAGIGVVHEYERYTRKQGGFRDFYTTEGNLLGWYIQRRGVEERMVASDYNLEINRWEIVGYMALQDELETEILFDEKIDAIRQAFRLHETLGGLVDHIARDGRFGIQVDVIEPVLLSGMLCHRAKMSMVTVSSTSFDAPAVHDFERGNVKWDQAPPDAVIDEEDDIYPETD